MLPPEGAHHNRGRVSIPIKTIYALEQNVIKLILLIEPDNTVNVINLILVVLHTLSTLPQ